MLKEHEKILRDVFINPDILNYLQYLKSEDFNFYRTFSEENGMLKVHHLPSWTIKPKYKIIDYKVNDAYFKNIKLIRKLEYFIDSKPFQMLPIIETAELINTSYLEFNKKQSTVIYREIYTLSSLIKDPKNPDYYVTDTESELFHEILNEMLSSRYTREYIGKDFIDLTRIELDALIMYWR